MAEIPSADLEWARDWIASNHWEFARTMAHIPHEYNVKTLHETKAARAEWARMRDIILSYGWIEQFNGTPRPHLIIDECKFWWIDPVINRCQAPGILYGPQWAPRTRCHRPATSYDRLALTWDRPGHRRWPFGAHNTAEEEEETLDVLDRIVIGSNVLDLGCGTGRLLDLLALPPAIYLGVDPSSAMLNRHVVKRPKYRVRPMTAGEFFADNRDTWDTITALFGAASELEEFELRRAYERASQTLFLMFNGERPGKRDLIRDLPGIEESTIGRWSVLSRQASSTVFTDATVED